MYRPPWFKKRTRTPIESRNGGVLIILCLLVLCLYVIGMIRIGGHG